jgi:hypothetical protein
MTFKAINWVMQQDAFLKCVSKHNVNTNETSIIAKAAETDSNHFEAEISFTFFSYEKRSISIIVSCQSAEDVFSFLNLSVRDNTSYFEEESLTGTA